MALRDDIVNDLIVIEGELGNPTFTYKGSAYNFIPSISDFNRSLEDGGYSTNQLMTATVRKLDASGSNVFVSTPTAQETITYNMDGSTFRIESVRHDATGAYFRINAVSTVRGI